MARIPPTRSHPHREGRAIVQTFVVVILIAGVLVTLTRIAINSGSEPRPDQTVELGALADPGDTYDPVRAGEDLPSGYRQLLRRDAILPIYDPEFVRADDSPWPGNALVIGVGLGDEAKAYPVSFLNRREMVIDSIAGIPILVTW